MFEHQPYVNAFRGLAVAVSLALLSGCGGGSASSGTPSTTPSSVSTAPAAPSNVVITAGNASVALQWSSSNSATSYNVKRATTSGGPYTTLASVTTTSFTDSSVTNGTAYFYVVTAVNAAGESASSTSASASPAAAGTSTGSGGSGTGGSGTSGSTGTAPAAPTGLAAAPGNAQVSLSWSTSSSATSYHVKRATTSGGPYTQVAAPTATSYSDVSVTNGTTYFYVVSALNSAGESANSAQMSALPTAPSNFTSSASPVPNNCGQVLGNTPVIFCDTFNAPTATTGTRAGALDPNVWGVSRSIGAGTNFGQLEYDMWNQTQITMCDGSTPTVNAPNDIVICNGQLREATDDNNDGGFEDGTVTSLAMYPKQPFDFAGRTGTVSFDVSDDAAAHGAWPEFWLSDAPVPDPFNHFDTWESLPANGLGLRFDAAVPVGTQGPCVSTDTSKLRVTLESASVIRSYVEDDTLGFGPGIEKVQDLDCVIESSGPGQFNHFELRISQNQIDVYATDAGVAATSATLKHIAVVTNANLTLTRGLIWLEDVHYNGDKVIIQDATRSSQRVHTFSWDNVAFDGPFTARDFAYDAPDNTSPGANGAVNLAKFAQANQYTTWSVANIPASPNPAAVKVLFNFVGAAENPNPTVLNVKVNGVLTTLPWPFPDQLVGTPRTVAVVVPLSALIAGTNTVQIGADQPQAFYNVDIVLADVPGGVPVLPGSNNAYP